jgi:long-subunit acyl-CoA synthetase (AMP-forming)
VFGDGRPDLGAIIALDPAADRNDSSAIDLAVEQLNATTDEREHIQRYAIVDDEWQVGHGLTETLKLRRDHIAKRYATEIERLYHRPPQAASA